MLDRKIILYVFLGVIVFALWDAWQRDYGDKEDNQQPSKVAIVQSENQATGSEKFIPDVAAKTLTDSRDSRDRSRLVKVKTDLVEMEIDLDGGDINQVKLLKYPKVLGNPEAEELLSTNPNRFYTAKSGLIQVEGDKNIPLNNYSSAYTNYQLEPGQDTLVVKLVGLNNQAIKVNKTYTFARGKYGVEVEYNIDNNSSREQDLQFYTKIKRKNFDQSKGFFQLSTYSGAAISRAEKPYDKISFSDLEKITKNKGGVIGDIKGGWAAMQQRYFLSVWIPEQNQEYRYFCDLKDGVYTIGFGSGVIKIPAGKTGGVKAVFYAGPALAENLAPLARGLDRTVDYGWLWIISVGLFWILKQLHRVVSNWGAAIILITLLIKAVFYKLSESSCRSMAKMKELMPKMQALKERYSDDKQKLHQATMEMYKREKINPLNLGGCLPMLIQIPFFIALYYVLIGAVELRQAPFIFWIHDLSIKDPFYVMPILMGITMFLQQKLTPSSLDPAQAKMMMFMPLIFTFLFANFPAGLVLYWLVNNALSILQQWYINKKLEKAPCRIR